MCVRVCACGGGQGAACALRVGLDNLVPAIPPYLAPPPGAQMYLRVGSHDNVVALRGLCQHEGAMFLVLEYCPRWV